MKITLLLAFLILAGCQRVQTQTPTENRKAFPGSVAPLPQLTEEEAQALATEFSQNRFGTVQRVVDSGTSFFVRFSDGHILEVTADRRVVEIRFKSDVGHTDDRPYPPNIPNPHPKRQSNGQGQ
jgi:hypothetical protein